MNEDYRVPQQPPGGGAQTPEEEASPIELVAKKASRFSREFVVTVFAVVSTAFGFVVALAWNTALTEAMSRLNEAEQITGLFVYAGVVTFLAVIATILLGRLAVRIGAQPVEFKLPAKSGQS